MTTSPITHPTNLLKLLRDRGDDLCVMPTVAIDALKIADDPDALVSDFAKIVERDVSLAAEMIRSSNSSIFALRSEVLSVHQAVHVLGFRKCKNLLLASCAAGMMKNVKLEEAWIRDTLWRHSYVTGMTALNLNHFLRLGFQGEEFTAGLIHDIGRTLLAVLIPEEFSEVDSLSFVEDSSTLNRENQILGSNHAELGGWFVASSGLPEALYCVVKHHHHPIDAPAEYQIFVGLISAADHMANHIQRFGDSTGYDPFSNAAVQFLEDRHRPGLTKEFSLAAHRLMEESQRQAMDAIGDD